MIDILSRNFEDGNIKFIVDYKEPGKMNEAIRLVEVFNDKLEENKTLLRPIGFKINNFGTNNPLHTSEDYIEAAVDISRGLDKHQYYYNKYIGVGETVHVYMVIDSKQVRMSTIKDELEKEGVFYKPVANDKPILTSLKDSTELEIVFSKIKDTPSQEDIVKLCRIKGVGEYFLCNVANIGALHYRISDSNKLIVDAGLFVSEPKTVYKSIVESLKKQFNKF